MKKLRNFKSDIYGSKMYIESKTTRRQVLNRLKTFGFNVTNEISEEDNFIYITDEGKVYTGNNYGSYLSVLCEEADYNSILDSYGKSYDTYEDFLAEAKLHPMLGWIKHKNTRILYSIVMICDKGVIICDSFKNTTLTFRDLSRDYTFVDGERI